MAKPKKDVIIGAKDFLKYLEENSDFSFEMTVLEHLNRKGFVCEHGGTYEDPFKKIPREFDIRARFAIKERRILRLAVECKNIKMHFPVLVSRLPRREQESYHYILMAYNKPIVEPGVVYYSRATSPLAEGHKFSGDKSFYKPGEFVGKSLTQVGRTKEKKNYE